MFQDHYQNLKVLLTGNTGFKGAWLTSWLLHLEAEVVGYSLAPPTAPNLYEVCSLEDRIKHYHGDVRDRKRLAEVFEKESPDLVIHFAAQSLVLTSYENPVETFEVNVQGTVNLLDAALKCSNTKAALIITTDKVYENNEWTWGYRENDRLGGHDPYSASKAMAEIAVASYRRSFCTSSDLLIASARAGNVIGGGDFAENRLLPDTMKALMTNQPVQVRNPSSIRPWMHVLDPLSGYLWLGHKLMTEGERFADAWNFAPKDSLGVNCQTVVERAINRWGGGDWFDASNGVQKHEMRSLRLNGEKAAHELEWLPTYDWLSAVDATVGWYKAFQSDRDMYTFTISQINEYTEEALKQNHPWTQTPTPFAISTPEK